MPNIASLLKDEIARVARKAVRTETLTLKKSVSAYRTEIASLKRRAQALEQQLRRLNAAKDRAAPNETSASARAARFSAKGLMAHRRRMDLSAADYGLLLGASSQSVYNWEAGIIRPKSEYLPVIAAIKGMPKKRLAARQAELKGDA